MHLWKHSRYNTANMPHSKLYLVQNLKFSLASKRQNIFQLDTSVAEFHGVLPEEQIFLSHALDDKKAYVILDFLILKAYPRDK